MLNDYAEVRPLGAKTYLVKNDETFFVRKKASLHLYALCQSLIGITCPNLPQIYEVYSYPDFAVVIREYVKGEPLSLILEREKNASAHRGKAHRKRRLQCAFSSSPEKYRPPRCEPE